MLLVDPRGGPEGEKVVVRDLLNPLIKAGLPAQLERLDSADIAFIGKGAGGAPVHVGIELKRLDASSTDLTQSLQSGRLSGEQLPKMIGANGAYDYGWLLIEGTWRHNESGQITVYRGPKAGWVAIRGGITAAELEKRTLSLQVCAGLFLKETNSRRDTVRFIAALYRWFTSVDLDKHSSHLAVHKPSQLIPVSAFRQAVASWPGVGLKTSKAVEKRFSGSVRDAASASAKYWAEIDIDGRKFGMARASKLCSFLNGEK